MDLLYEDNAINRELLSLSLVFLHIQGLLPKCALRKLFQEHQKASPSCTASKERGDPIVTSRWEGSNSCTLARHPSSCPPFMQQLARYAGHVLAYKRLISTLSIHRNKIQSQYVQTSLQSNKCKSPDAVE